MLYSRFEIPDDRNIEDAHSYWVKWDNLHVVWKKGEQAEIYEDGACSESDENFKDMFEDKNNQEAVIENNSITDKWCIVRPGGLTTTKRTTDFPVFEGKTIGQISRADLAKFCIDAINDVNFEFFQKKISLSNVNTHHLD